VYKRNKNLLFRLIVNISIEPDSEEAYSDLGSPAEECRIPKSGNSMEEMAVWVEKVAVMPNTIAQNVLA
jgi:hypothetical protein